MLFSGVLILYPCQFLYKVQLIKHDRDDRDDFPLDLFEKYEIGGHSGYDNKRSSSRDHYYTVKQFGDLKKLNYKNLKEDIILSSDEKFNSVNLKITEHLEKGKKKKKRQIDTH